MSRHLLYHIMPIAGNGTWQWNLDQLCPRLPLFDGLRVCAIVTQTTRKPIVHKPGVRPRDLLRVPLITDPPEKVIERLKPHGFKFIVMENRPELGEVATFYPLMKAVKPYTRPDDFTLWAHAKGVTRLQHTAMPCTARRWAEIMYETTMDYWPLTEEVMKRAPVAGSFLKFGNGWIPSESLSQWHYSGSWFWFRNCQLFCQKDWWKIDRFWSGIEAYPSLHFDQSQCGSIFMEGGCDPAGPNYMSLYKPEYFRDVVEPNYAEWKAGYAGKRTVIDGPESWCPTI